MDFSRSVAVLLFIIVAILAISSADPPDKHTQTGFTPSPSPSSPRHIPSSGRKHPSRTHKDGTVIQPGYVGSKCSDEKKCNDGMICSTKKHVCACATDYVAIDDKSTCVAEAELGGSCEHNVQCSWVGNATCSSGTCRCQDGFRKGEDACVAIKIDDECNDEMTCGPSRFECSGGLCKCSGAFKVDGTGCIPKQIGDPCSDASHCTYENGGCAHEECACGVGHKLDDSTNTCVAKVFNDSCSVTEDGNDCNNLMVCDAKSTRCACSNTTVLSTNLDKCEKYALNGAPCVSDANCKDLNALCTDEKCACDPYNEQIGSVCVARHIGINGGCADDKHCSTQNSFCSSGTCKCSDGYVEEGGACAVKTTTTVAPTTTTPTDETTTATTTSEVDLASSQLTTSAAATTTQCEYKRTWPGWIIFGFFTLFACIAVASLLTEMFYYNPKLYRVNEEIAKLEKELGSNLTRKPFCFVSKMAECLVVELTTFELSFGTVALVAVLAASAYLSVRLFVAWKALPLSQARLELLRGGLKNRPPAVPKPKAKKGKKGMKGRAKASPDPSGTTGAVVGATAAATPAAT